MQETIVTHDERLTYAQEDQPKPSEQEALPQIKPPQSHQSEAQQQPPTQGQFQQINLSRQVMGKRKKPLRGDETSWPFERDSKLMRDPSAPKGNWSFERGSQRLEVLPMFSSSQDWTNYLQVFDRFQPVQSPDQSQQSNNHTYRDGPSQPGANLQQTPQTISMPPTVPSAPAPSQGSNSIQGKGISRRRRLKKILKF
ncbi:hypothetical protein OWV82_015470 [Melia azedarach]|uniref:Uncharacterized protein n=1 Tax=Melia azedarach TaxID=155640 RepID=A0ACC1XPM8_MELAZ|nr:hypothetical protein OWV82_015470 [Melia azedarach]